MKLTLEILPTLLAIAQLPVEAEFPTWAAQSDFWSVTKTKDEISVICEEIHLPNDILAETGWSAIKIVGPLDFAMTGIMAQVIGPLAEAEISIFASSTYDTDYILVKSEDLEEARTILGEVHDILGG